LKKFEGKLLHLRIFPVVEIEILSLINQRLEAKERKDFNIADDLRNTLATKNWQVDDYAWGSGVWWKPVR
jgi:cysteinyl-tRNA synthetase